MELGEKEEILCSQQLRDALSLPLVSKSVHPLVHGTNNSSTVCYNWQSAEMNQSLLVTMLKGILTPCH